MTIPLLTVAGVEFKEVVFSGEGRQGVPRATIRCISTRYRACEVRNFRGTLEGMDPVFNVIFDLAHGKAVVDGTANISGKNPEISCRFSFEGLDLLPLTRSLNENLGVSGLLRLSGNGTLRGKDIEGELSFSTEAKQGISQYFNFAAVKAVLALGGGNPVRSMAMADFSYRKAAGRITIKGGRLTVEGLAGKQGKDSFLVRGGFFGPTINILIDSGANTIRLDDFRKRIAHAITASGTTGGVKFDMNQ